MSATKSLTDRIAYDLATLTQRTHQLEKDKAEMLKALNKIASVSGEQTNAYAIAINCLYNLEKTEPHGNSN